MDCKDRVLTPTNEDITAGWIPTTSNDTVVGSDGIILYNAWTGNTQYWSGTESSLSTLKVKQTANAQTNPDYYYAEAIRIPNNVAYASCTAGHKYRMTFTFDANAAGGTVRLYQNGYNQGVDRTVTSGTKIGRAHV